MKLWMIWGVPDETIYYLLYIIYYIIYYLLYIIYYILYENALPNGKSMKISSLYG